MPDYNESSSDSSEERLVVGGGGRFLQKSYIDKKDTPSSSKEHQLGFVKTQIENFNSTPSYSLQPPQEKYPGMTFLNKIKDETDRLETFTILNLPDLSKEDRLGSLGGLVSHNVFIEIQNWLEKKENGTDFIEHLKLDESSRKMVVKWTERLQAPVLESYLKLNSANSKAMECFERWKEQNGLNQQPSSSTLNPSKDNKKDSIKSENEENKPNKKGKKKPKKHRKNETESEDEDESKSNKSKKKNKEKKSKKKRTQSTSEDSSSSSAESSKEEKPKTKTNKPSKSTDSSKTDKSLKKAKKNTKEEQASDQYDTAEEVEEIEIINASLPSEVNIVLLGGTGIGKSTFINAIANMLSHRNLDEAKMEVHVLIKTAFHFIEPDTNIDHKITMEPTIAIEKQGEPENENTKVGESCTKLPKSYVFKYGRPGFERTIRIIDTPGVGDTNGVEQDRENFRHIINFVSSFREIHAFLFVLKPNDARLELQFRYCIKELLTHLHVSATENIIFCMTNGKGTNYKPGETFGTLQALLNTIKEERNIEIRLQERCLVFDNEFYRYLCEVQHNMKHTEMEIKNHHESWNRGKNELSKMMKMIANLTPHDVNNTLSVNKVRRAIEIMSKPLAELAKNLLINIGLIEDKQEEIQECLNKGEDFKDRLFTRQIQMNTEELDDPMTVCGHPECSKREPLHEGGVEEIIYGDPCHDKCYLQNIAPGEPPGEAIKSCEIFGNMHDEYTCSACGHNYEDHLHMRYKLVREVTEVIDLEVQRAIVENNDKVAVANLFLERKREEIHALETNLNRKQTICAHFAIFLKDNSVLAYNDQYMAYMNGLIREERERVQRGSNEETLNRLETCQFQYIELKKVFDNPTNGRKMTLIEIEDLIEEIKKMDDGDIIKDIHNLEIIYPAHLAFDSPPIPIRQSKIQLIKSNCQNKINQIFNSSKSQSKKGKKY